MLNNIVDNMNNVGSTTLLHPSTQSRWEFLAVYKLSQILANICFYIFMFLEQLVFVESSSPIDNWIDDILYT
jgi:hypothetical protein